MVLSSFEQIFVFIVVFFLVFLLSSFVGFFLRFFLEKKLSRHNARILTMIVQYSIVIFGTYYINSKYFGFDFKVFATSLGILTVAVAFSSQQIIQNFIAGLLISIKGPFELEDWVEILPVAVIGKVKEISLMRTRVRDISGKIHYIPNSLIITSRIINHTRSGFIEVQVPLVISSKWDYAKIKDVILEVLNKNLRILPNVSKREKSHISRLFELKYIKEFYSKKDLSKFSPRIVISDLNSEKITLSLRFWIGDISKKDEVVSELLMAIRNELQKKKIEF